MDTMWPHRGHISLPLTKRRAIRLKDEDMCFAQGNVMFFSVHAEACHVLTKPHNRAT